MSQQARRNLTRTLSVVVGLLCLCLSMFAVRASRGEEETFRYLRQQVLKNKPFPWEA